MNGPHYIEDDLGDDGWAWLSEDRLEAEAQKRLRDEDMLDAIDAEA